jgi:RNA polymerase sigma-70 factor (ECF subfamily)
MPTESGSTALELDSLEPTDAKLVANTRAGDATAFEALVRRHYRTAFSVALAQTGNATDAEDVCQDAFIRAAEHLEACRQPERFGHWLCTIVRNHARNTMARARVRRTDPLEHETAASRESPQRNVELSDLRARLVEALTCLPSVQREVVLLHDLQGLSHDEIGAMIGTSAGMSRQHLFKARKRLREALGERSSEDHFNE